MPSKLHINQLDIQTKKMTTQKQQQAQVFADLLMLIHLMSINNRDGRIALIVFSNLCCQELLLIFHS